MNYKSNSFFGFYFFNINSTFTIKSSYTTFYPWKEDIHMQGRVSQNFDLSFC